jgi:hypothetical protein
MAQNELVLRVKMIDGRELAVSVPSRGRIADIAERVLEVEDAPMHKMIRLIYGGRLLQPHDPIANYNIGPDVVIHAVISDAPFHAPQPSAPQRERAHTAWTPTGDPAPPRRPHAPARRAPSASGSAEEEPLESALLKVPPGIILVLLWYVFATRGADLFSWFSTLSLVILTMLYLVFTLPRWVSGPVASLVDSILASVNSYAHPRANRRFHQDVSPRTRPHFVSAAYPLFSIGAH